MSGPLTVMSEVTCHISAGGTHNNLEDSGLVCVMAGVIMTANMCCILLQWSAVYLALGIEWPSIDDMRRTAPPHLPGTDDAPYRPILITQSHLT